MSIENINQDDFSKETEKSNVNKKKNLQLSISKKITKEVEKFYKKPETHQELVENMRILREIPEDKVEPKVIVKLGSPEKEHKFVYMKDDEDREYVMALPIEKKDYHRKIVSFAKKLYGKDLEVIGGGYIHTEKGKMVVDRSSGDYGVPPKNRVKEILMKKFPGLDIEVQGKSLDGEEAEERARMEAKKEQGNFEHEIKLEDEFLINFYNDVLNNKALKLGMDYTSTPKRVEGAENLSYMVYSSENGSSFGFDTLYVGYKDKKGEIKSIGVVKEKGYIHINEIKVEDNVLSINYSCDGRDEQKSIPLDQVEKSESRLKLDEPEKNILKMYKDMQPILSSLNNIYHGVSSQ